MNDNAPEFLGAYAAAVDVGFARPGWRLARLRVHDADAGHNATVKLSIRGDSPLSEVGYSILKKFLQLIHRLLKIFSPCCMNINIFVKTAKYFQIPKLMRIEPDGWLQLRSQFFATSAKYEMQLTVGGCEVC